MKNVIRISIVMIVAALFVGCSSRGMMTASHNGKMYWNPGNCSQYKYYNNTDAIKCVKDGIETGVVLYPASQQQVNNHYREKESNRRAWNDLNNQLDQMNKNNQMQMQNFQLQQLNNNLNGLRYGY